MPLFFYLTERLNMEIEERLKQIEHKLELLMERIDVLLRRLPKERKPRTKTRAKPHTHQLDRRE